MERRYLARVTTFFCDAPLVSEEPLTLGEAVAHHARVKRLTSGDPIGLTNGAGGLASARLEKLRRGALDVMIERVWSIQPLPPIHLCVPIGDRDRMLWLGEKATELGITSWRAVRFRRSASVFPRGEGKPFLNKLRARMIGALEQSGGAWLPEVMPDSQVEDLPQDNRLLRILLHAGAAPLLSLVPLGARRDVVVLVGPEGGLEPSELEILAAQGWRAASLAPTVLRFETAAIAAVAVLRAASLHGADGSREI